MVVAINIRPQKKVGPRGCPHQGNDENEGDEESSGAHPLTAGYGFFNCQIVLEGKEWRLSQPTSHRRPNQRLMQTTLPLLEPCPIARLSGLLMFGCAAFCCSFTTTRAQAAVHYVNSMNVSPAAPYVTWETAATNIQDAVDAGTTPGRVIVVTNGTYATGQSSVSVRGENQVNRIAITNGALLKSVNGPAVTVIDGTGMRCIYLGGGAQISGFTLANGSSIWGGAGVASDGLGIVTNCIITNNVCPNDGHFGGGGALNTVIYNSWLVKNFTGFLPGGGAMGSELINCIVSENEASEGGGVAECLIRNCTVTQNQVPAIGTTFAFPTGGGASKSTIDNCIVEFNTIEGFGDPSTSNHVSCLINYSCTGPLPASGHGNFSADPRFVSAAGNNFRLAPNSPCINSGLNSLAPSSTDLDGLARIVGSAVDMGAYEYLTPKSILSYAWLQKYGLPIDGSADFKDSDADGVSNAVEWEAGTNPKDSQSKLKLLPLSLGNSGALVTWKSVSERNYTVQRAHALSLTQTFETISPTLPGQTNITSYLDPTPIEHGPFFYRVKVLVNE